MLRVTFAALLRSIPIAVAPVLLIWLISLAFPSPDANIGAGLMAFMLVAGLSFLWALFDGLRHDFAWALPVWLPAALIVGLATPPLIALGDGDWDWEVIASDLFFVAPFAAALVGVPALIGAAAGSAGKA